MGSRRNQKLDESSPFLAAGAANTAPSLFGLTEAMLNPAAQSVDEPQIITVAQPVGLLPDEANGVVWIGGYGISNRGILFRDDVPVTPDEWRGLIPVIAAIQTAYQWIVADWCEYGAWQWGETYDTMAMLVKRDKDTIANWASVGRAIQFSRRRELSFSHHVEVAAFEDEAIQDAWLDLAVNRKWSRNTLRKMIVLTGGNPQLVDRALSDPPPPVTSVTPSRGVEFIGSRESVRELRKIPQLLQQASAGNERARLTALGWVAIQRDLLDQVEARLKGE